LRYQDPLYSSCFYFPIPKTLSKDNPYQFTGTSLVTEFYKGKGNSYIQLKGKGLYHLGEDLLNLGVPQFDASNCNIQVRMTIILNPSGLPNKNKPDEPLKCVNGGIRLSFYMQRSSLLAGLKTSEYSLDGAKGFLFPNFPSS